MQAQPFRIQVEQAVLDDLLSRLQSARWTSVIEQGDAAKEIDWTLGTGAAYLQELVNYWRSGYRWREQEARLNELPHFKVRIEEAHLHFVHVKARSDRSLPLLLLHGWPDSFCRYRKVIPKFSAAFDIVVPSLPGFAFTGEVKLASQEQPNRQTAKLLW